MTSKGKSKVVTPFLDGVDVRAAVKDKKLGLFHTAQRSHSASQSTPDNDRHNDPENEDQLARLKDLQEKTVVKSRLTSAKLNKTSMVLRVIR